MAAVTQRKPGAFANLGRGVILPVSGGVLGAYFLGGNAQNSRKNHAAGGQDGIIVGTPEYHEGYVRFTGQSSFMELDIPESSNMTLMLAWKSGPGAATYRFPLSNIGTSTDQTAANYGFGIRGTPATDLVGVAVGGLNGSNAAFLQTNTVASDLDVWSFSVATISGDGAGRQIINATTNQRTTVATPITGSRLINSERKFRVGSSFFDQDTGQSDIAAAFLIDHVLTDVEWGAFHKLTKARIAQLETPFTI